MAYNKGRTGETNKRSKLVGKPTPAGKTTDKGRDPATALPERSWKPTWRTAIVAAAAAIIMGGLGLLAASDAGLPSAAGKTT